MKKVYQLISNFLVKIAISTLTTYSWIGMYELEKPNDLYKMHK